MAGIRKIFESDLALLKNTFFDELKAVAIYDPKGVVNTNFDTDFVYLNKLDDIITASQMGKKLLLIFLGTSREAKKLDLSAFGGIICHEQLKTNHKECTLYYYKSKFDTIRFGYPKELKTPAFYDILHENYEYLWYSQLFDKALFASGLKGMSAQGAFFIYHKRNFHVEFDDLKSNEFFIFSENYVFDRTSQCFIAQNGKIEYTVKYGDSELALRRSKTEGDILTELNKVLNLEYCSLPKVISSEGELVLSNNWPTGAQVPDLLEKVHYQSIGEIYNQLKSVKQVAGFIDDQGFLGTIQAIKNILEENLQPRGLSATHIEELCIEMLVLLNSLNPKEPFYTSIYHGSFSPTNIPVKGGKVHLNNWEKAETDMPLLFDVFYFLFYRMENAEHPNMGDFDDLMKRMIKNSALVEIIKTHDVNFKLNLALFHVYHILERLQAFLKQRFINPNANFTLAFWRQTLERINRIEI